jgi:ubiquinone/menaquinone biosynthesis C-methylase UbiE
LVETKHLLNLYKKKIAPAVPQTPKILEVGQGAGRVYMWFKASKLPTDYTMCDFVDKPREATFKNTGIMPDKWNGRRLPYNDKYFDFVILFDVLLHVPPADIVKFMAQMKRVTKRWIFVATVKGKPARTYIFDHKYAPLFDELKLDIVDAQRWKRSPLKVRWNWLLERRVA